MRLSIRYIIGLCFFSTLWAQPQSRQELPSSFPIPREDNRGDYLCPFTSDGVITRWIDRLATVQAGEQIGQEMGKFLLSKIFDGVGGALLGREAGRAIALKTIGGENMLRQNSDLSFDHLDDMLLFMALNFSHHPDLELVVAALCKVWPDTFFEWPAIKAHAQSLQQNYPGITYPYYPVDSYGLMSDRDSENFDQFRENQSRLGEFYRNYQKNRTRE